MIKYIHASLCLKALPLLLLLLPITLFSYGQGRDQSNLFAGFRNLQTARTNLPIGAVWTPAGPTGEAARPEQLTTSQSFTTLTSSANRNASASVSGGILKLLAASVGFNSSTDVTVRIDSVSIVTLNSPEALINNANSFVLYEAIRAEKLTFKVDKSKAATLAAGLRQLPEAKVSVDGEGGIDNTQTVTTRGARLFVAYRLARVDLDNSKKSKVKLERQGGLSVGTMVQTMTPTPTRIVYKSDTQDLLLLPDAVVQCINGCSQDINSCASRCTEQAEWQARVIDHTQTRNGRPLERLSTFRSPFNMSNQSFGLAYKPTGEGFTYKYLFIERLDLSIARTRPEFNLGIMVVKEKGEKAYVKEDKYKYSKATPPFVTAW